MNFDEWYKKEQLALEFQDECFVGWTDEGLKEAFTAGDESGYRRGLESEPLTSAMDNRLAWSLGEVAAEAGNQDRTDVGDLIDRGLILRRLLEENGFLLVRTQIKD